MKNQLSAIDLVKLARACPKVRKMLKKTAQDDTMFDENVPVVENAQGMQMGGAQKPGMMPQQQFYMPQQDQFAAQPMEGEMQEGGNYEETPEQMGARAAQAFLGPEIWNAALQGDPNAQNIISRTAGQVASSVTEMSANMMAGVYPQEDQGYDQNNQEMNPGMEVQASPNGAAQGPSTNPVQSNQAITTPEQDLANSLAPNSPQSAPIQSPAGGANPPEGAKPAESGKPVEGAPPVAGQQPGKVQAKPGDFSLLKKVIAKIG